jgi:hypothetical protein
MGDRSGTRETASDSVSGITAILLLDRWRHADGPYVGPITCPRATTLKYFSADQRGNIEEAHAKTVLIDGFPPLTSTNATAGWVQGSVDVTMSAIDTVSGVAVTQYSTDGSTPSIPYDSAVHITAQGTTTLKYRSTDVKGNVEDIRTAAIRIDNTAPAPVRRCRPPLPQRSPHPGDTCGCDGGIETSGTVATHPWYHLLVAP